MSQYLSRARDWFRALSTAEVVAVVVLLPLVVILILVVASGVLAAVARLTFNGDGVACEE